MARGAARHTRVVCPGRSSTMVCRRWFVHFEHVATPAQEGAVETTMTVAASVCSAVATLFTSQRGSAHQGKFMPFHPLGTRHGALAPTSLQATRRLAILFFACKHTFCVCTPSLERTPRREGVGVRASASAQSIHLLVLHRESPTTCVADRSALLLYPPH